MKREKNIWNGKQILEKNSCRLLHSKCKNGKTILNETNDLLQKWEVTTPFHSHIMVSIWIPYTHQRIAPWRKKKKRSNKINQFVHHVAHKYILYEIIKKCVCKLTEHRFVVARLTAHLENDGGCGWLYGASTPTNRTITSDSQLMKARSTQKCMYAMKNVHYTCNS